MHLFQMDIMSKQLIKPGSKAPVSGQAVPVGPRGGKAGNNETTIVKGKTVPPTPKPGQGWVITDPTKHKKN